MNRKSFIRNVSAAIGGASFLPLFSEGNSSRKKSIRFAHLTDIHVKKGEVPETGMAKALHHAQSLSPKVDFIMNGGDSIMDALEADKQKTQQQFQLFKSFCKETTCLYITHGNHDIGDGL
jgi:predicted MPP superfamily phosphohydrolase